MVCRLSAQPNSLQGALLCGRKGEPASEQPQRDGIPCAVSPLAAAGRPLPLAGALGALLAGGADLEHLARGDRHRVNGAGLRDRAEAPLLPHPPHRAKGGHRPGRGVDPQYGAGVEGYPVDEAVRRGHPGAPLARRRAQPAEGDGRVRGRVHAQHGAGGEGDPEDQPVRGEDAGHPLVLREAERPEGRHGVGPRIDFQHRAR
mmetsp:Transcript_9829/g.27628  ORF Transcript_9829/g.27628 Transcript_9829/m.27628 type:complete len:202 (+) Transcript_9829:274-879(+)